MDKWKWKEAFDMFKLSEKLFNLIISIDSMNKKYSFP